MKNFIFLFVFTISNLAYSSALPDDDYLPNQPHPSDPDYTQPKIPKKTNIPTNTTPANDPIYDPPKTKPKPGKLPNPGKLGGIIGSIVGDYIIGKVDEGLDWILDPANHEPKRKPLPQPKTQYKVECKGYGEQEVFDSATDYLESLIHDLEKKGWYDVKFIEYKDNNTNYSRQLGRFYGVFSGEDGYGKRHTFNYGDVICRRVVNPKTDKTPQGPDATPPQPQPNPNNEPAPKPSPRPSTEPSPRPSTEPSPRPSTEPSPRPGVDGKDGRDGKSAGQGKPFELPKFCDWAKPVCDFMDWFKKEPKTSDDIVPTQNIELQDPASFDKKYINASKSCPPDVVKSFSTGFANNEIRFSMKPICDFASDFIRPVVIFLAYIFAIINIGNAFKVG